MQGAPVSVSPTHGAEGATAEWAVENKPIAMISSNIRVIRVC